MRDLLKKFRNAIEAIERQTQLLTHLFDLSLGLPASVAITSDIRQVMASYLTTLAQGAHVDFGTIEEVIPRLCAYRVSRCGGGPPLLCCRALALPNAPVGVSDNSMLSVGTNVYFCKHRAATYGIILGAEPPYLWDARKGRGDCIGQASGVGFHVSKYWKKLLDLAASRSPNDSGVIHWGSTQPVDSLSVPELLFTSSTGLQLFMDDYMAHLRVNEMCGVSMFYWDSLLRLAGRNMQTWTSATEEEILDDEGELSVYRGMAYYPWEQYGTLWYPRSTNHKKRTAAECDAAPYYAKQETKYDDHQPLHRFQEWGAYLGGGSKRLVCAPPPHDFSTHQHRYSDDTPMTGLCEEQRLITGQYALRSATSITITKRPCIPVPHRKRRPEDTTGDTASNHKASGLYGSGASHIWANLASVDTCAAWHVLDWHAMVFNWEGVSGFHYRSRDFDLPNESDLPDIYSNQRIPWYGSMSFAPNSLGLGQFASESVPIQLNPGATPDRYQTVGLSTSYLHMSEDGGIVLSDGWGSEIRMANGCIYLLAADSIIMHGSRDIAAFAGRCGAFRARGSLGLHAATGSAALTAGEALHIVSGHAEEGGALVLRNESTSEYLYDTNAGVFIETPNAPMFVNSSGFNVRCNEDPDVDTGIHLCTADELYINADRTAIDVDRFTVCAESNIQLTLNYGGGPRPPGIQIGPNCMSLSPDVLVDGNLAVAGTGYFESSVYVGGSLGVWGEDLLCEGELVVDNNIHCCQGNVFCYQGTYFHLGAPADISTVVGACPDMTPPETTEPSDINTCLLDVDFYDCSNSMGCDHMDAPAPAFCQLYGFPIAAPRWMILNGYSDNPMDLDTWTNDSIMGQYPYPGGQFETMFGADVPDYYDLTTQLSTDRSNLGLQNAGNMSDSSIGPPPSCLP